MCRQEVENDKSLSTRLKGHCHGVTCAESQQTLSDGVLINKLFFPYISLQIATGAKTGTDLVITLSFHYKRLA